MTAEQLNKFGHENPGICVLRGDDSAGLECYLRGKQLIADDEKVVALAKAGEGNMNCTLRATTAVGSLIVKQSRPWVEKYPSIAADWDRVLSEARFYMLVSPEQRVADRLPNLLHLDTESRLMVLEDLGESLDFTDLYQGEVLASADIANLAAWLSDLHELKFTRQTRRSLTNRNMRKLNHEHIFDLPLRRDNGLVLDNITPGLTSAAEKLIADGEYMAAVRGLGDAYLTDEHALLHGDFFPGSWLKSDTGPKIIDPEFAFFGAPEFDLGVLLAHLYLADQPEQVHAACLAAYQPTGTFDYSLAMGFCGTEIMRRIIGVAQLSLAADVDRKQALLTLSRELVLQTNLLAAPHIAAKQHLRLLLDGSDARQEFRRA